jgi:hypothetical protein
VAGWDSVPAEFEHTPLASEGCDVVIAARRQPGESAEHLRLVGAERLVGGVPTPPQRSTFESNLRRELPPAELDRLAATYRGRRHTEIISKDLQTRACNAWLLS